MKVDDSHRDKLFRSTEEERTPVHAVVKGNVKKNIKEIVVPSGYGLFYLESWGYFLRK